MRSEREGKRDGKPKGVRKHDGEPKRKVGESEKARWGVRIRRKEDKFETDRE